MALAVSLAAGGVARAERVHDLSRALVHGKRAKTRISAAISLARLVDPRSLKPLVRALGDENHRVRALAAFALGRLGDSAALPALRRVQRDANRTVRQHVAAAMTRIRERKNARTASADAGSGASAGATTAKPSPPPAAIRGSEGALALIPPVARPAQGPPQIYVMLASVSDESSERAGAKARNARARQMRSLMVDRLSESERVKLVASGSRDPAADPYTIDLTMMKLAQVERAANVEVECEIRVAISTREGKMLSFLTGGAKVQVPKASFRDEFLPQLRREALEGAVRSVHGDLVTYLTKLPASLP
ncbi:MAG TPA: HEAT repeat domain-containing protein [Kofleriaceae bacterium]|nr:HEAT repeat domain-containing protein [Kofleriaceae bacterium]